MGALAALFAPIWGYIAAAAGALLTLGGIYVKGRADAANKARAAAMQADINAREARHAVDRAVSREPDPVGRLRAEWGRPDPVRPVAPNPDRRG